MGTHSHALLGHPLQSRSIQQKLAEFRDILDFRELQNVSTPFGKVRMPACSQNGEVIGTECSCELDRNHPR